MRTAYLECFSGISGDMLLGALVDAGVPFALLEETAAALNVGARLEVRKVMRGGLTGTKVDVIAPEVKQDAAHAHAPHRHLSSIVKIILGAALTGAVKERAIRAFTLLGEAEAAIHSIPIEKVHFHEVGAVDTIVDIVCAAAGADSLQVDRWLATPLNVGSGTVVCQHGTLPVPAPATLALLADAPIYAAGPPMERVTPTRAARSAVSRDHDNRPALAAGKQGVAGARVGCGRYGMGSGAHQDRALAIGRASQRIARV